MFMKSLNVKEGLERRGKAGERPRGERKRQRDREFNVKSSEKWRDEPRETETKD